MMEYGLIGEKLGHSFSKVIHNEIGEYDFEIKEIPKDDLDSFMRTADFKAITVTIPYKEKVIPYLYKISDQAEKIGAVNTIVNKDGKLYGYNTDFWGLIALLNKENIILRDKKVLILGAGGTSKTAFAVAEYLGAKEILRVSRNNEPDTISYKDAVTIHNNAQVIINTTPVGMYPKIGLSVIDIDLLPKLEAVADVVYNPICPDLVVKAKERGIKATGGLYMLVAQGIFAAEKFFQKEIDKAETDRIFSKILSEKKNIVLIGMPTCGKTTIGKAVANNLGKNFIDTDEEIVKETGISIPEFFERFGEKAFREKEREVIEKIAGYQNSVIATGGGAILNSRNIQLLRENGVIIFIDRPLEKLITADDRPLSSNRELLKKRYEERYHIYKSSADICVDAVDSLEENINKVTEVSKLETFSN